jgi:DUF1680 family protein
MAISIAGISAGARKRWTNLRDNHELYCAGHMLEGAVAISKSPGRRRLLDIMLRYVDHIDATFGPRENQKHGYQTSGNRDRPLALSPKTALLDLAAYFIDERGKAPTISMLKPSLAATTQRILGQDLSVQSVPHAGPTTGQSRRARGQSHVHVYRHGRARCGARHVAQARAQRLARRHRKRMYLTGGLGPAAANEGFTEDDLPNDTAYAETCASVALIFWAQRMLHLDLDGKYADILELRCSTTRSPAVSGRPTLFLREPLESDGRHSRWEWHLCPCCTMNVAADRRRRGSAPRARTRLRFTSTAVSQRRSRSADAR